jgi:hypothetical protein
MVERGRVPNYAVRHRPTSPKRYEVLRPGGSLRFPIHTFLFAHYSVEADFNGLEIWKRNEHSERGDHEGKAD